MIRNMGDWLRHVTRESLGCNSESGTTLERSWADGGYGCIRVNREIPELELVDAIVCAIRDGDWEALSMARNEFSNVEKFCGEFLDRMRVVAADNDERSLVAIRSAEFAKWKSRGAESNK